MSPIYSGQKRRRSGHPRFVLGSSKSSKKELSVDAEVLFKRKNSKSNIPFKDVVIRWGAWPLKINDALIQSSSCGHGKYYVARHIWGNYYWLDDGKTVTLTEPWKDFCAGGENNKKTSDLTLNFQKTGGKSPSDIMIWIKSCEFKWNNTSEEQVRGEGLSMECKEHPRNINGQEETVTLTLESNSYKS